MQMIAAQQAVPGDGFMADREFHFTDRDFRYIQRVVREHSGIVLSDTKRNMVYSRLARRLRELRLQRFSDYLNLLERDEDGELGQFINAMTTNLTAFFRENHHFEFLSGTVVPEVASRSVGRRMRVWSAGCSTGEEPYSLAITLQEATGGLAGWDARILATDLDTRVIATGERGVYREDRIEGLDHGRRQRWFLKGRGASAGMVRVSTELQDMIRFRQLNLLRPWPMKGPFDVIFCRNVVIYFDKDTQRVLFDRFADLMTDGGYLFIGHSESLFKVSDRFELLGNTIYRKRR